MLNRTVNHSASFCLHPEPSHWKWETRERPHIRGLRVTVHDVLEHLAAGITDQDILTDFPDVGYEDINACLSVAADRERRFVSAPPA